MLGVSEGFGAAAASGGEGTSQIAISQTFFDFRASNKLMKKTSIETVTVADGVYSGDSWR